MVVTSNDKLYERVKLLRTHGVSKTSWDKTKGSSLDYDVFELGHNYRMSEINAALGLTQLTKLERNNQTRRELTQRYRENLLDQPYITIPFLNNQTHSSCHVFPIILSPNLDRDGVIERLKQEGIQTTIHYPPVHQFTLYAGRYNVTLPRTEDISRREITLPLHPLLEKKDVDDICSILYKAINDK